MKSGVMSKKHEDAESDNMVQTVKKSLEEQQQQADTEKKNVAEKQKGVAPHNDYIHTQHQHVRGRGRPRRVHVHRGS